MRQDEKEQSKPLIVFLKRHCKLNEQLRMLGLEYGGSCRVYDKAEKTLEHLLRDSYTLIQRV